MEPEDELRWRNVHRLIEQWTAEGDSFAGELVLSWIQDGTIATEVTSEGLLLKPGPEWPTA